MKQLVVAALATALLPAAAMAGEAVVYEVGGAQYEGYFAPASGDSKGLVVIIHDWDGLDTYEMDRADLLAEAGYDAFAIDLFGQGNRPETNEGRMAAVTTLYDDRETMRALLIGGLEAARGQADRDAVVIGYCFGGAAALELARSGEAERIAGYATFHGGLETPAGQSYPESTPPILVAHGGADTSVTMDHVAQLASELEAAGVEYEIEIYSGAPHAFTVEGSDNYQERADRLSWDAFADFLNSSLGS